MYLKKTNTGYENANITVNFTHTSVQFICSNKEAISG